MAPEDAVAASAAAPTPGSIPGGKVLQLLQGASRELRELDVGRSVDRVPLRLMTPLRFATEYVQRNKPVVITGAIDSWRASRLWGERYLAAHPAGKAVVTVDVTPNGRGDAVTTVADPATGAPCRWFVTPHERRMTLADFFRLMKETRRRERRAAEQPGAPAALREVPYMQHQNSNLSEELGLLLGDIRPGLPWAEQVFGGPPEATNIWIGDERSATSFHKDHYENLYAVIRGTKIFTLLPPCDAYRMYLVRCPAASYMPRRAVLPGMSYGEVSPQPGGAPCVRRAGSKLSPPPPPSSSSLPSSTAAAVAVVTGAGVEGAAAAATSQPEAVQFPSCPPAAHTAPMREAPKQRQQPGAAAASPAADTVLEEGEEREGEEGAGERLVAVLLDTGYEVLWSAVDLTVEDPDARRAQPLFYGDCSSVREADSGRDAVSCSTRSGRLAAGAGDPPTATATTTTATATATATVTTTTTTTTATATVTTTTTTTATATTTGLPRTTTTTEDDARSDGGSASSSDDPWDAAGGAPLVVEVGPGEVMYLPAIWYHQVEQRTEQEAAAVGTATATAAAQAAAAGNNDEGDDDDDDEQQYVIAVNFWYDMKYDSRYSSFKLVEGLAMALGLAEEPPQREAAA